MEKLLYVLILLVRWLKVLELLLEYAVVHVSNLDEACYEIPKNFLLLFGLQQFKHGLPPLLLLFIFQGRIVHAKVRNGLVLYCLLHVDQATSNIFVTTDFDLGVSYRGNNVVVNWITHVDHICQLPKYSSILDLSMLNKRHIIIQFLAIWTQL